MKSSFLGEGGGGEKGDRTSLMTKEVALTVGSVKEFPGRKGNAIPDL